MYDEELEATFKTPGQEPSPILISLENHCGPEGQLRLVQIMNEVWGDRLLSKAIREGADPEHVTLKELRASIAVIVEFHFPDEVEHDDDDDEEEEEEIYGSLKTFSDDNDDDAETRKIVSNTEVGNDPLEMLAPRFTAHVPVPTQKDIEEALLKKRKQELLEKYVGSE